MDRKGILLAGGTSTRLHPTTLLFSKQCLPVYDKPLIYYPLVTLMQAGIRKILVISTPSDLPKFQILFGTGDQWGIEFSYAIQEKPDGIAQALLIGERFLDNHPTALILGDNIFYGPAFSNHLENIAKKRDGATIFAYSVQDPNRYGVVELDPTGKAISIEEKPLTPRAKTVVTGLYFYDQHASQKVRSLTPSRRGELEITDLNCLYLEAGQLNVHSLEYGCAWLDAGTPDSLLEAGQFIGILQHRQGIKVGCPEETAWRRGWIDDDQLKKLAAALEKSAYGQYLYALLDRPSSPP